MKKQPMIVIVGPTASGKTKLSVDIAKRFDGEIISADSMQIYKGMSIATAKPTIEEMQGIKHYLIDCIEPEQSFSVADYVCEARKAADEIYGKNKLPVVVGGTGLYVQAFVDNVKFDDTCSDTDLRKELSRLAEENGNGFLWEKLNEVDPQTAAAVHPNNLSRVIRALEVFKVTGIPISQHKINSRKEASPYDPIFIGLTFSDRNILYDRIDKRVDQMVKDGLVEEARQVWQSRKPVTARQAIGYKELIEFFEGKSPLSDCIDKIKQETRHYAKRQLTWFRRDSRILWFEVDKYVNYKNFYEKIENFVAKTRNM